MITVPEGTVAEDRSAARDRLVAAHEAVFDGLLDATDGLDEAAWATPTGCPGWDVHDQLAHVVGLERRLLGDPEPDVEVPDLPHLRNDVGRFVERDVLVRRGVPAEELRAEARETFARRLEELRALSPESLDETAPSLMGPMKRSAGLRMRVFDSACHERDVRAAVDRLEGFAGPHLEVAIENAVRGWSRVVPPKLERAGTIRIEVVDGPTIGLDLGAGTLTRGADVPPEPEAVLRLTGAEVLALAGGRDDVPEVDAVHVGGDLGVCSAFLAVAGITP